MSFSELTLSGFKCHKNLALPLRPFTVLTGFNSAGKSSVIQALMLIKQSEETASRNGALFLNGPYVNCGTLGDVQRSDSIATNVSFSLASFLKELDSEVTLAISFSDRERKCVAVPLMFSQIQYNQIESQWQQETEMSTDQLDGIFPRSQSPELLNAIASLRAAIRGISYLSAHRVAPLQGYPIDPSGGLRGVGASGEYVADLLVKMGGELLNENDPRILGAQRRADRLVESWMREFFPGITIGSEAVPQSDIARLVFHAGGEAIPVKTHGVGLGITQTLPVITAGIAAPCNSVLVIENPECHLHPAAQSLMGRFLTHCVKAGVQVILETHSDHLLNGIRIGIKDQLISGDKLALYFFHSQGSNTSMVTQLQVSDEGKVEKWPDGFFDQYEKDIESLLDL